MREYSIGFSIRNGKEWAYKEQVQYLGKFVRQRIYYRIRSQTCGCHEFFFQISVVQNIGNSDRGRVSEEQMIREECC